MHLLRHSDSAPARSLLLACAMISFCGCSREKPDIRETKDSAGNIEAIQFYGRNVLNKDLQVVAKHDALTRVEIQECSKVNDDGLTALIQAPQLEQISLVRVPITDDGLAILADLANLSQLNLAHTEVKGSGLASLSAAGLTSLSIVSRTVDAAAMSSLEALANDLQELQIDCQEVSLSEMPYLGQLKKLESFVAMQTPVGEQGLESLRGLSGLRVLKLSSKDVGDSSIDALNTLSSLEEAELSKSTITDDGLGKLQLPNLKMLKLNGSVGITDAGFERLAGLPNLEVLMANGTGISGADFSGIRVLPNLKEIYILGNQFKGNDESIKQLKQILPNCELVIQNG
ncbi:MAG: hypothetical protein KDB22_29400 [Planctomycetales bacterium]|nr:hypothetical protein [Planctomycetales bacterium]